MVSGGTVTSDLSSLKSSFQSYNSEVEGLSGSWKGLSHDNLVTKVNDFFGEYSNAISSEMESFAAACDLYVEYENNKKSLQTAQSNYNTAVTNKDSSAITSYGNQVSTLTSKINTLKTQIESLLASASAVAFQSSSSNTADFSSGFTAGKALEVSPGVYEYTFTSSAGKQMKYYAYIPNNATEGMPLILYLHGDGSVNNMKALKDGEMSRYVRKVYGDNFPFIYIQPMTEVTSWTNDNRLETLSELVKDVANTYKCDTNKIILTGMSRGGNGSWSMANAYPELFSCFVPVSGRADIDPSNFKNLPTVAFSTPHSSDSWNYNKMQQLVKAINEAGGNAQFVSKNGYTHSSVSGATYTDDLFKWMIAQTKAKNA